MACNVDAVRQVRKRIEGEPAERFEYANLYTDLALKEDLIKRGSEEYEAIYAAWKSSSDVEYDRHEHDCNTAACVAGWACLVLKPGYTGSTIKAAQKALGIGDGDAMQLFQAACDVATRKDAIARLKWLEQHGSLRDYPWETEEGYALDSTEYAE